MTSITKRLSIAFVSVIIGAIFLMYFTGIAKLVILAAQSEGGAVKRVLPS